MAGVRPRVDVATCARAFVSRVAHELEAGSRRAEELRTRAAEVARWLRERGATDVWLYGSLAWGEPHGQSDVDLLVEERDGLGRRLDEALAYASAPQPLTAEQAAAAALSLERAYTALESILERATRTLEGEAPSGPDWHRRLLDGALLAIDKVRPALLSERAHDAADELLRFRHFLRHAYSADLDPQRVGALVKRLRNDRASLESDLDSLEAFLLSMADEIEG